MGIFVTILAAAVLAALIAERAFALRARRALLHVIHVNGTRGKSGVARLIAAGLGEGGVKVWCKTTGTLPMIIDTAGNERLIKRRGPANISEQIRMLCAAAREGAQVLVIECMAVDPELQFVCEHRILHSDIGVITNARIDHVAEMGTSVPEVIRALSATVPDRAEVARAAGKADVRTRLFTADPACAQALREKAGSLGTDLVLTDPASVQAEAERFTFPENAALALAVCESCGVPRDAALRGFSKVQEDPYAVSVHTLPGDITFVDLMSANDPFSTQMLIDRYPCGGRRVYVLNCRRDRGPRTKLMTELIREKKPDEIWLIGAGRRAALRLLERSGLKAEAFASPEKLPLFDEKLREGIGPGTYIYAIGNIAGPGVRLMEMIGEEEAECTLR